MPVAGRGAAVVADEAGGDGHRRHQGRRSVPAGVQGRPHASRGQYTWVQVRPETVLRLPLHFSWSVFMGQG